MPIDVKQGQMLIRKIQYLLDGLELNAAEISNIEKDLMLGYISSLYELFLFDEQAAPKPMTKPKKVVANVTKPVRVTKEVNEITYKDHDDPFHIFIELELKRKFKHFSGNVSNTKRRNELKEKYSEEK